MPCSHIILSFPGADASRSSEAVRLSMVEDQEQGIYEEPDEREVNRRFNKVLQASSAAAAFPAFAEELMCCCVIQKFIIIE